MSSSGSSGNTSMIAIAFLVIATVACQTALAQERTSDDSVKELLAKISIASERLDSTSLQVEDRSRALDESIELRAQLIASHPNDQRRATWHADQAENLLLRRLAFPQDWAIHLLNADRACPLMPPEIPVIVANGITEAMLASASAVIDIRTMEEDGDVLNDPAKLSLLERLRFERDLRAPLLEGIGLVLASRIDPNAAVEALEILNGLNTSAKEEEAAVAVIQKWRIQAMIEAGDADGLELEGSSLEELETDFDRVRLTAVLKGPRSAASLASRRFQMLPDEQAYERMLLGDLRERYLADALKDQDKADRWSEDRGDLWIELLSSNLGKRDWSIDPALSARLAALSDQLDPEGQPLASAWALGQRELARRSQEEGRDPAPRILLGRMLEEEPIETPGRARALSTLAQLALADGDRLAAALAEEKIYLDYPHSPVANPARVADLIEPWALAGEQEAETRYERALRASVERMKGGTTATPEQVERQQRRLLQLANHLSRTARGEDAKKLYKKVDPASPTLAAALIAARAENIHRMHEKGALEDNAVRPMYQELRATIRIYAKRFGSANPQLRASFARAGICEVLSSLQLQPKSADIEMIEEIANNGNLDANLRIEAHLIRHDLRMRASETRQEAILRMPDLLHAIRLDKEIAANALIERAEILVNQIDELRKDGHSLRAETLAANELRPIANSIDLEMTRRSSLMERLTIARAFQESGNADSALNIWDALAEEEPSAYVVLQGRADALFELEGEDNLREAMLLYRRLGQGNPGQYVPAETWWHAQLKQLLVLEKVKRSLDRIAPRVERLRLRDPEFGGLRYREAFESLLTRRRR